MGKSNIDKNNLAISKSFIDDLQSYLETVVSLLPAHIYWKDTNGRFLACNDAQAISAGFSNSKEMVGKTDYDMPWKDDAEEIRHNDFEVIKYGKHIKREEVSELANGEKAIFLSQKVPLVNKEGKAIGVLGVSIDITDRKKAEEDLKQALQKVELASNAKTEFLENMRHDLRTALSGIQGFSELLRSDMYGDDEKTRQEYIDNLVASCRALTHIHNQILHAIHVFSGDIPEYKNKFDLEGRLKQIVTLHLAKAREKDLQLSLSYDKKIPKYLVGDCRRLTAIALELISNALKYTEQGKVKVTAALEKKQGDKSVIKFSVQDTGIGIPEDKKSEIFARFSRLTHSYEGKYVGLGLGLSVVKQFVDDLGGEIYVDSKLKQGTTFTCYLPFAKSLSNDNKHVEDQLILPLPDMEVGGFSIRPIVKQKIMAKQTKQKQGAVVVEKNVPIVLQVEDEEVCALITRSTLAKFGIEVDLARNGAEALQKFQSKQKYYSLILMDVGLPDISGTEVTRKIRVEEKSTDTHIPIVALTAHVDSESKQQCIESGMDAVLSKPISNERFAEILNAFLPGSIEKNRQQPKIKKVKKVKPTEDEKILLQIEGPIIDFDYMQKNFLYSHKETKHLLQDIAIPALAKDMKIFNDAYAKKDWPLVQKMAHKMSGACSSCGLKRLWAICKRVELYLMGKNTKLLKELITLLIKEYKDAQIGIRGL